MLSRTASLLLEALVFQTAQQQFLLLEWKGGWILGIRYFESSKARLLLQLALTKTSDPKEIQRMFDEY